MLDDFLEGLTARWQEFLDWSDEKGLPLRGASDSLEQNGIPPAPFFLGLFIILIAAIGYIAYSNMAPSTGTITISVRDLAGVEVSGASVVITDLATHAQFENLSDFQGVALFAHVPLAAYNVSVSSSNYKTKFSTVDISESLSRTQTIKLEEQPINANATIRVNVDGLKGAAIPAVSVKNSLLSVVASKQGASVVFSLPKSAAYTIIANAEGYTQNSTVIQVGSEDPAPISIYLYPVADETTVDVTVQLSASANASLSSATVKVLTESGLLLRSLNADSDGKATVKLSRGGKFRFIASLEGYDEAVLDYTADPAFKSVKISLSKAGSDGSVKTSCTVVDEAGNKAGVATVNLYLNDEKKTSAKTAADGIASFSLLPTESYWVTAYKSKYLPTGMALTAGADCRLVLVASTKENAAKVKVKVTDEADGLISGASVALFGNDGALGLPESTTGSDGAADFSDVPLSSVYAFASSKGRSGYSASKTITVGGEDGKNYTTLTARLLPQQGTLKFRVIDRFSRKAITGAVVDASTTESGSCTTINGLCSVGILEGWGHFKVTATGYSAYSSAQVQVVPNVEKELQVELLSSSIAENVKAVFLGLYDLSGSKVSSLEPSTTYNAKFLINAPDLAFSKAALHVRLGTTTGDASTLNAYISGYDGGTDASTSGGDSYGVSAAVANTSASSSVESAYDSASSSIEYKWAELSYPPFAGTKEAYVQITTRQVRNGTVLLGFRTAYTTANGTLRDPSDDSVKAGQEQLAAVNVTKYSISFGGVCAEGQCLEAKVESTRGEYSKNFEATVPEEFTLTVKSIAQNGPYDLRILLTSKKTAAILSGSSPSGAAVITDEADGQLALVSVPSGNVDATFKVKALRVSDALSFAIEADYEGEKVNGLELSGRVISASNNELNVGISPSFISALAEKAVTFLVTDAFGTPIEEAHIAIGSKTDIFGSATYETDGSGEENAGKDGKYLLEDVYPDRIGNAEFSVTATGYTQYYGAIPVTAKKIVEISPTEILDLVVDSKAGNSDTITVSNLLDNGINVRSSVVLDKTPRITGTLLSESNFALEAGETQDIKFDTWILDSVLDVAKAMRTLSENFSGRIIIEARAGSSRQSVSLPFKVNSAFVQNTLDEFWGTEEDSAELTLYLGSDNQSSANVHVYNSLKNNLLVNYQLDSANDWLSFSPASLVLGSNSGESGQIVFAGEDETAQQENIKNLTILASTPSSRKTLCVMENNGKVTTNLTLVASINGIRSERKIPVTLNLESDVDCAPDNAVDVLMPLGMKVDLSAKTLKKENADGSIAVQEPNKDTTRVVFGGASLSDSKTAPYVTSPSGSTITASPSMAVIIKPQEEFSLALPYATTYYVNSYFERANNADGSVSFTLESEDIVTFPAGSTIGVSTSSLVEKTYPIGFVTAKFVDAQSEGTTQSGFAVKVRASAAVGFKVKGSSAACTSSVGIPKSSTIALPSGTQITTTESGSKEAALPDCSSIEVESEDGSTILLPAANKVVLPGGSEVSRDRQAQSASVPASSEMQVSYCTQTSKDSYSATFGEDVSFRFSEKVTTSTTSVKFGSCQQIVTSNGYTLPPATAISFDAATEVVTDDDGNTAVNLYAGNKVTFASCVCTDAGSGKVRLTQGVTATSGSALSVKPSTIEFTLTDGALSASNNSVCVSNSAAQSLNVSAKADNIPAGIITGDDIYFGGEYSHSGVIASSKANTCSALTIKAKVPDSLLDSYGCIKSDLKQPKTYEGKIKLTAKTLSGVEVSGKSLPEVAVKITVKQGKCENRDKGITDAYLKDVFVNYDSKLTDAKTNVKRVFAFKNIGNERYMVVVNNLDIDVTASLSADVPGIVDCSIGDAGLTKTIKRAEIAYVKCTSKAGSEKGEKAALSFHFTGESYDSTTKVNVVAYSSSSSIYSSSPLGDMLPLDRKLAATTKTTANAEASTPEASFADTTSSTPTPSASAETVKTAEQISEVTALNAAVGVQSVGDCTTNFCTVAQAQAAYLEFAKGMKQIVDYIASKDEDLTKRLEPICTVSRKGAYTKSMVLQLANTNESLTFLNSIASEQLSPLKLNIAAATDFAGCGIYPITIRLNICNADQTSAAGFRESASFDVLVSGPEHPSVIACKENLANAMLLMGDSAEVIVGNERTKAFNEEFVKPFQLMMAKPALESLKPIRMGVYKMDPNERDNASAISLMGTCYGQDPRLMGTMRASGFYNDDVYCGEKGALFSTVWVGGLAALDASLLPTGALSSQAILALAQGIGGCGTSTIVRSTTQNSGLTCSAVCECPMNFLAAQLNFLGPGLGLEVAATAATTRQTLWTAYGGLKGLAFDAAVTTGAIVLAGGSTTPTHAGAVAKSGYQMIFNQRANDIQVLRQMGALSQANAETLLSDLSKGAASSTIFGKSALLAIDAPTLAKNFETDLNDYLKYELKTKGTPSVDVFGPSFESDFKAYASTSSSLSKDSQRVDDFIYILKQNAKKYPSYEFTIIAADLDNGIVRLPQEFFATSDIDVFVKDALKTKSGVTLQELKDIAKTKGAQQVALVDALSASVKGDLTYNFHNSHLPSNVPALLGKTSFALPLTSQTELVKFIDGLSVSSTDAYSQAWKKALAQQAFDSDHPKVQALKKQYPSIIDPALAKGDPKAGQAVMAAIDADVVGKYAADDKLKQAYAAIAPASATKELKAGEAVYDVLAKQTESLPSIGKDLKLSQKLSAVWANKLQLGKAIGIMGGMMLVFAAMDCDYRPTQAISDPAYLNHFVFYSRSTNVVAGVVQNKDLFNVESSAYRYCPATESFVGTTNPIKTDEGNCFILGGYGTFLESALPVLPCPKDKQFCLALLRSDQIGGSNGYTMFVGMDENTQKNAETTVFKSIFESYAAPLNSKTVAKTYVAQKNDFKIGYGLVNWISNKYTVVNG